MAVQTGKPVADSDPLMLLYRFYDTAILTVFNDNSGMAIYNAYDGNTVFLNASPHNNSQHMLPELPAVFSAAQLAAALGIAQDEVEPVLQYLQQHKLVTTAGELCA